MGPNGQRQLLVVIGRRLFGFNTSKVRRNFSSISCADFGKTILDDISATTVARCEQRMGACLIAAARLFYSQLKHDLFEQSSKGFCISIHSYRQDATNGKVKLSGMELETMYIAGVSEEEAHCITYNDFQRTNFLSDIVQVGDESGPGCVGITLRGFASQGCPSWRESTDLCKSGQRRLDSKVSDIGIGRKKQLCL